MIQAFVSGQLSEADHDLMAHHIATCEQCAAAVAAERAVRGELAKLLAHPDAVPVQSQVVDSVDLNVPPVPELQLDFVLDRTSEAAGLLLPREPLREVALDQLPPAPAHSERRSDRAVERADAGADGEAQATVGETQRVAYADDIEVATATAAGIADSVAHAAAALASDSLWEPLHDGIEDAVSVETSSVIRDAEARPVEEMLEEPGPNPVEEMLEEPGPAPVEMLEGPGAAPLEAVVAPESSVTASMADLAVVDVDPIPAPIEDVAVVDVDPMSAPIEDVAVVDVDPVPAVIENMAVSGEAIPVQPEVLAVVEKAAAAPTEIISITEESEPTSTAGPRAVEEDEAGSLATAVLGREAEGESAGVDDAAAKPPLPATRAMGEAAQVSEALHTAEPIPVSSSAAPRRRWARASSGVAAVVVIGLVAIYAAAQLRPSGGARVATAAAVQPEQVAGAHTEWRMTPSVLTPILDSAAYNRVLDVSAAVDSLADSLDDTGNGTPRVSDPATPPASLGDGRPGAAERSTGATARLPQIVSEPRGVDAPPARSPQVEALPEVVRGNAAARTRARGSAVVISGMPDVPRLLRTTTHRPRPEVAYVLREYDASGAEPTPRAGVNEYRWSDATGSRLYVLSGPVGVTELRAYARRLQTRPR